MLRSDLQAVGAEVVVQEDFTQHPGTLLQKLEDLVAGCDRVIALVGSHYGAGPEDGAGLDGVPPRSYTQWEYHFACGERLDGSMADPIPTFVYFASPAYLSAHPTEQPDADAQRQWDFIDAIIASNKDRNAFDTVDHLARLVLRDGFRVQSPERWVLHNLPFASIGDLFKGRTDALAQLDERLDGSDAQTAAITARQAIHGLGGIGKTRLAIEYAWQHIDDYPTCLFVGADSPQNLDANLAQLCVERVLDLPEKDAQEQEMQTKAALRWFAQHDGWLLILDNVDTPEAQLAVGRILPQLRRGRVLITSRLADWDDAVQSLPLDTLDNADAVAYLLGKTHGRRVPADDDDVVASQLAETLGGLALALEQAGKFIARKRIGLSDYLQRWQASEAKLREWRDPQQTNYPHSLAVTWETSFEQLSPEAQMLLNVLSFFAPDPIPRDYFAEGFDSNELAGLVNDDADTSADVEDLLDELASLSLLRWEESNRAFTVHRLVQEIARARLEDGEKSALGVAVQTINRALPGDPPPTDVRSWSRWDQLRAHAERVIALDVPREPGEGTARLCSELGLYLKGRALYAEAEPQMLRAFDIYQACFGLDHPKVVGSLTNLASLKLELNQLVEASSLLTRAKVIGESLLDRRHPQRIANAANYAELLRVKNRPVEAEALMWRVMTEIEISFGREAPLAAIVLGNLALLFVSEKRFDDAELVILRAISINFGAYGRSHQDVAENLNTLGGIKKETGAFEEAETLIKEALKIDEEGFGCGHPKVANRLDNLATLLVMTGREFEAEPLMMRALAIEEGVFGRDHPTVAIRLNNLGALFMRTGRLVEAESVASRGLKILIRSTLRNSSEHCNFSLGKANYLAVLERMGLDEFERTKKLNELIESAER